ncbi:hypothetical protein BDY19DRAFT_951475 [Irpex rosettiformis]|uniref:Uncharacterized protein n=1 Tax=Irpex rosettiformis TaxID=378272 RepID=A0ACB8U0X9_9APHY|nr:hypothetical protein BDY19DRAFT_951475 [Irpex rosettiformis]
MLCFCGIRCHDSYPAKETTNGLPIINFIISTFPNVYWSSNKAEIEAGLRAQVFILHRYTATRGHKMVTGLHARAHLSYINPRLHFLNLYRFILRHGLLHIIDGEFTHRSMGGK